MKKVYDVSVKLLSALHINGGVDPSGTRVTIKSDGAPYIPATLFKGIVRENFGKIAALYGDDSGCTGKENADRPCSCLSCRMFGKAGFQRSRLVFDNLTTQQESSYLIRTNVSINRYLQKAHDGALVFTQTADRLDKDGNDIVFSGQMTAHYPDDCAQKAEAYLITAAEMIKCIGLGKSRGLGFVEVTINEADS
ncbi:MAG: hypothetical protein E7478_00450 [Ruminococcaceae bacterium]|nr:hypothetical protein [Oscillospiraceae bacterium]